MVQDNNEPDPARHRPEACFVPHVYQHAAKGEPGKYVPAPVKRVSLETGDYTLPGLEWCVALERKTIADLIGTLFSAKQNSVGESNPEAERFKRELERMRAMPHGSLRAVFVEADVDDIERELYKVPKDWRVEFELAANEHRYDGTFAEGALPCESCPAFRWPGERCYLCGDRPPGKLLFDGVAPVSLLHRCDRLALTYNVSWMWLGSKASAEKWVGRTLQWVWEEARGEGAEFKKAIERGCGPYRPWLAQHLGEKVA